MSRRAPRQDEDPLVSLSKKLSWLLRHAAEKEGVPLRADGYARVTEVLAHKSLRGWTEADVERVVAENAKQRFKLETFEGVRFIRANQGHSLEVKQLELQPIDAAGAPAVCIHGTYLRAWDAIRREGLRRMSRAHIHFAEGEPGQAISGMRANCEVLVYVDVRRALEDGYAFFRSANGVLLCPGDPSGLLPTAYFDRALRLPSREPLPFAPSPRRPLPAPAGPAPAPSPAAAQPAPVAAASSCRLPKQAPQG